jgi:hypothetical protein
VASRTAQSAARIGSSGEIIGERFAGDAANHSLSAESGRSGKAVSPRRARRYLYRPPVAAFHSSMTRSVSTRL